MMNFLALTGLLLIAFFHGSHCRVSRNKSYLADSRNEYYEDLSKIPPARETAARFAKYFLDRDDVDIDRTARRPRNIDFFVRKKIDSILMIDSSESVKRANFVLGLKALRRVVLRGKPDTHYAAISFSNHAKLEFVFSDKEVASKKLKQIEYRPGKTNTQEALLMALNELIQSNTSNIRQGSSRRILLITDGLSNVRRHLTLERGRQLKEVGVEIFVMAVGQYNDGINEIVELASSTHAHLYRVHSMRGFLSVTKMIPKTKQKTWLSGMNQGGP